MEDEFEEFQDFSKVTAWEEIAARIEEAFHVWAASGSCEASATTTSTSPLEKQQVTLEHSLPHRVGTYLLTLHSPRTAQNSFHDFAQTATEVQVLPVTPQNGRWNDAQDSVQTRADDLAADPETNEAAQDAEPVDAPSFQATETEEASEGQAFMPAPSHSSVSSDAVFATPSSTGSDPGSPPGAALEESPPLFARRQGLYSPDPSIEDLTTVSADRARWTAEEMHAKMHAWFAVDSYVLLVPNSYSGRIMDEQEAHVLLSAAAVAAASSHFPLPCFVPVHDGLRDAYWGFGLADGISTRHFATDSVHIGNPPPRLRTAEGQLSLFAERLLPHAPEAAAIVSASADTRENVGTAPEAEDAVRISLQQTWQLPRPAQETSSGQGSEDEDLTLWTDQWDAACCWWPWASQADPCGELELKIAWLEMTASEASGKLTTEQASQWILQVLASTQSTWRLRPTFLQFSADCLQSYRPRLRLELPSSFLTRTVPTAVPKNGSLAAMLASLWEGRVVAASCGNLGRLANSDWWGRKGSVFPSVPSEAALQDVLRDLFGAISLPSAFSRFGASGMEAAPELGSSEDPWGFSAGLPGCAPASSLAARLSMHALTFSNPRAIATLWVRFVRELRFAHWEALTPLPRMPPVRPASQKGSQLPSAELERPDLRFSLLHQKLQMLNACIALRQGERVCSMPAHEFPAEESWVVGVMEGQTLLGGDKGPVRIPATQIPPLLTADVLQERQEALQALGSSPSGQSIKARLEGELLASDMSAFKAANPGALLEDFVRWHSPRDWIADPEKPLGGSLSPRISGLWLEWWTSAEAIPASRQRPLMDSLKEGERVLHWFEHSLQPAMLWELLAPVALSSAIACLAASRSCTLPVVSEELSRFHKAATVNFGIGQPLEAGFPGLLMSFQHLECMIVAGESLLLRLPGAEAAVNRLLEAAVGNLHPQPNGNVHQKASGIDHGESVVGAGRDGPTDGVRLRSGEEHELVSRLLSEGGRAGDAAAEIVVGWVPELQSEWTIEILEQVRRRETQRLYALVRPGEMRIATSIAAEL